MEDYAVDRYVEDGMVCAECGEHEAVVIYHGHMDWDYQCIFCGGFSWKEVEDDDMY